MPARFRDDDKRRSATRGDPVASVELYANGSAGTVVFLQKPFAAAELLSKVRAALNA